MRPALAPGTLVVGEVVESHHLRPYDDREYTAASRELAARCRPAVFAYPASVATVYLTSSALRQQTQAMAIVVILAVALLYLRVRNADSLLKRDGPTPPYLRCLFSAYVVFSALLWSFFSGYVYITAGETVGYLAILISVALGAGAISSLVTDYRLYTAYVLSLVSPLVIIVARSSQDDHTLRFAAAYLLGGVGVYMNWTNFRGFWKQYRQSRTQMEEVNSARERLEMVVSGSNLGTFDWRLDREEFFLDSKAPEALGYSSDDFAPVKSNLVHFIHPDDLTTTKARVVELLKKPESQLTEVEVQLRDYQEQYRWFKFRGRVVERDLSQRATRLAGTYEDITREKESEQVMLELRQRAEQAEKLKTLGVLAGGVAHDFNNMLTVFVGNIELAQMDVPRQCSANDYLDEAKSSALKASELCTQLLAYAGKSQVKLELFNLSSLVEDMSHLLQVSIGKNHELKLSLGQRLPPVEGDRGQIRQVILNLLTNAAEAMEDRSGEIRLTTSLLEEVEAACALPDSLAGRYVCLTITDQGCGMEPEVLERIFDPFFTTKFTGRGLGLASAQGIARSHGGQLTASSTPEVGTVFRLYLPAKAVAGTQGESEPATLPNEPSQLTILVADDEAPVRKILTGLLSQAGHQVFTARDGIEALEKLMRNDGQIDLVVLDLIMPRKDGFETLTELRSYWPNLPVLLSSGYSEEEVLSKAKAQVQGFLKKPFSKGQLLAELEKIRENLPRLGRSDALRGRSLDLAD